MIGDRLLYVAWAAAALLLLPIDALAQRQDRRNAASAEAVEVKASRITAFERANPSRRRFGRVEFRGGLVLSSDDAKFGGLSDLVVAPDGRRFVAVSDGGNWFSGEIAYDGARPSGLTDVRFGPLLALSGRVLERKRDHDAEGVTLLDGSIARGTLLIAFERNQRIGRFPVRDGAVLAPMSYIRLPSEARRMKANQGFEAVAVLHGGPDKGAVLAVAERLADADDNHTAWLWVEGKPRRIALRNQAEFDITSAAPLGDGGVIILERHFRWAEGVRMRLRHVKPGALTADTLVDGETLFEADMAYEIDNMEGVAIHQGARGETVLTLISDDNFNTFLQRTLLLQFTLLPEGRADAVGR